MSEPNDLALPVDWMTWSHAELYNMVRPDTVDMADSGELADNWQCVARHLESVAELFDDLARDAERAWQGRLADLIGRAAKLLGDWSADTAAVARQVAGAVDQQTEHAQLAMRTMIEIGPPKETDPADAFVGGFTDAMALVAPLEVRRVQRHDQHRRAAEVMERYQAGGNEVVASLPDRFAVPQRYRSGYGAARASEPNPGDSVRGPDGRWYQRVDGEWQVSWPMRDPDTNPVLRDDEAVVREPRGEAGSVIATRTTSAAAAPWSASGPASSAGGFGPGSSSGENPGVSSGFVPRGARAGAKAQRKAMGVATWPADPRIASRAASGMGTGMAGMPLGAATPGAGMTGGQARMGARYSKGEKNLFTANDSKPTKPVIGDIHGEE